MSKRREGDDCSKCATELVNDYRYGVMCPKCGPGADKPRHPVGEGERIWTDNSGKKHDAANIKAQCKICGRADKDSCRSNVRDVIVWDPKKCPAVKARKGTPHQIGVGTGAIWYVTPPSYEWFARTGKVLQDKEAKKAKTDNQTAMNIGE
jgi:hypothetical protein